MKLVTNEHILSQMTIYGKYGRSSTNYKKHGDSEFYTWLWYPINHYKYSDFCGKFENYSVRISLITYCFLASVAKWMNEAFSVFSRIRKIWLGNPNELLTHNTFYFINLTIHTTKAYFTQSYITHWWLIGFN